MEYLRLARALPPKVAISRASALLLRGLRGRASSARSHRSYAALPDTGSGPYPHLTPHFQSPSLEELTPHQQMVHFLAARACAHEFNLLGSGWMRVRHGMECPGVEGHVYHMPGPSGPGDGPRWLAGHVNAGNAADSLYRYSLVNGNYAPIDWQLDFKSGFRWSASTLATQIRYGTDIGADIKVPWELARMQHLPQLAFAHQLAAAGNARFEEPERYLSEFRNQVLDFIASNPPGYGVNWVCTMDVAIRVSNWLISWDFFVNGGAEFSPEFQRVFAASVYDHGRHIVDNLEWTEALRSNHYLSNIAGLLFVSAYLPETSETNAWLRLSLDELAVECGLQFQADGSNFEASTSYHRLSAEMVLYATALAHRVFSDRLSRLVAWSGDSVQHRGPGPLPSQGLPADSVFSDEHLLRLSRIARFTLAMIQPDGDIAQIGDNDSGRFFKLQPALTGAGKEYGVGENSLDHSHLPAACVGFLDAQWCGNPREREYLEFSLLRRIAVQAERRSSSSGAVNLALRGLTGSRPRFESFPDFGAYVYRSRKLYLVVRCGSIGQKGNGGHAHNDQLSFTAAFMGTGFFVDPGTYLYTALPEKRNLLRSTAMHNTVSPRASEQNEWLAGRLGLFSLTKPGDARVLECTESSFSGLFANRHYSHKRTLEIGEDSIHGLDECHTEGCLWFHLAPAVEVCLNGNHDAVRLSSGNVSVLLAVERSICAVHESIFSPGYGELVPNKALCWQYSGNQVRWTVRLLEDEDESVVGQGW